MFLTRELAYKPCSNSNSMQPQCFFVWIIQNGAAGDQRKVSREQKLGLEQTCQLTCHPSCNVHTNLNIFLFSSPAFVWTGALNHVILLVFVLVVISHAPNSMQPQCFFCVDNSKWRCWWSAEGRKVSREQKLGLAQTCQLACHTSYYVHTNLSKTNSVTPHFFYISDITNSSSFNGKIFRKKSMLENFRANVLNSETLSLPSSS